MSARRRTWLRYFLPSVLGVIGAAVVVILVAAISGEQGWTVSMPMDGGHDHSSSYYFSIGIPTWYERSGSGIAAESEIYWINILLFAAGVYVMCMPLGRLITEAARPLRAAWIIAIVAGGIVLGAVLTGGAISRAYWGYWFKRPGLDWRVAQARSLERLTPIHNFEGDSFETLVEVKEFKVRDGSDWSDLSRLAGDREPGGYYTLHGRVLNALEEAGQVLADARRRTDAELVGLYGLTYASSWIDRRSTGLQGYAVDFSGPREGQEDLLLLTLSSDQVSNDHFAYYELLFGPPAVAEDETTRPLLGATRFYYDVAGMEGMEWYGIATALGLLGFITVIPLTAATLVVIGTRRRNSLARRGFAVEMAQAVQESE